MEGTERVTLRLPSDSIILLKSMVDDGLYHDLSEAVTDAIDKFIKDRMTVEQMMRAKERTSVDDGSLDELMMVKDDMDEAIQDAVKVYLEKRTK